MILPSSADRCGDTPQWFKVLLWYLCQKFVSGLSPSLGPNSWSPTRCFCEGGSLDTFHRLSWFQWSCHCPGFLLIGNLCQYCHLLLFSFGGAAFVRVWHRYILSLVSFFFHLQPAHFLLDLGWSLDRVLEFVSLVISCPYDLWFLFPGIVFAGSCFRL